MKFNEKLIELRKKAGLSQEELGYRLNVTRQTVSKWELGQTTPEMDKLIEISKIFNISVDELINENGTMENQNYQSTVIDDQPIQNQKNLKNKKVIIIVVVVIVVLALFGFLMKERKERQEAEAAQKLLGSVAEVYDEASGFGMDWFFDVIDRFFAIFDKHKPSEEEIAQTATNMIGMTGDLMESLTDELNNVTTKNSIKTIEIYKGRNVGMAVKTIFEEIIKNNQISDKKITVSYNGTETQDVEEIRNLGSTIEVTDNFEISYDYDKDGAINKAIIKKAFTEMDIKAFNSSFNIFTGSQMGGMMPTILDIVIRSNNEEERKVTVKYNDIETQDEAAIKNIKQDMNSRATYELTFEYDADGFINKLIIEKV